MDPPSNTFTVRRHDPLTVKDFLGRLLSGSENGLLNTRGQLTKAFLDVTTT
ncbi:MAG: hypothetical protein N2508_09460 [Anaerolineae bacterium]|nr:hypothetical protein [Anaerolineae bacterium]